MATVIERPNKSQSVYGEENVLKKIRTREYLACLMPDGQWRERENKPHPNALATVRVIHVWSTYKRPFDGDLCKDRINVRVIGNCRDVETFVETLLGMEQEEEFYCNDNHWNVLLSASF